MSYSVNEIFTSIDGEINYFGQGRISTFVRLQGCNLSCSYCDAAYAQNKLAGTMFTHEDLIAAIRNEGIGKVTITGGEPFLQNVKMLVDDLHKLNYDVSIETNGTLNRPYFKYPHLVSVIWDVKLDSVKGPSVLSEISASLINFERDYVKFVVDSKNTLQHALSIIKVWNFPRNKIAFSPVTNSKGNAVYSGNQIVEDLKQIERGQFMKYIVNYQIHKMVGMR